MVDFYLAFNDNKTCELVSNAFASYQGFSDPARKDQNDLKCLHGRYRIVWSTRPFDLVERCWNVRMS